MSSQPPTLPTPLAPAASAIPIVFVASGGILCACTTIAGLLILCIMRRRSNTFVLVAAMLLADSVFGLGFLLSGLNSLRLTNFDREFRKNVDSALHLYVCILTPSHFIYIWLSNRSGQTFYFQISYLYFEG
jgi:hypothetical protein